MLIVCMLENSYLLLLFSEIFITCINFFSEIEISIETNNIAMQFDDKSLNILYPDNVLFRLLPYYKYFDITLVPINIQLSNNYYSHDILKRR